MKGWLVWGTLVTAALAVGGYFYFHPLPGLALVMPLASEPPFTVTVAQSPITHWG